MKVENKEVECGSEKISFDNSLDKNKNKNKK